MKITVEIDETKNDDSYKAYGVGLEDTSILIYDSKNKLLIDGIFSKHSVEFDGDKAIKTIFELSDILEVKHCPEGNMMETLNSRRLR